MTSILTRALILVAFGAGVSIAIANRVERTHAPTTATTAHVAGLQAASPGATAVELPTIAVRPSMKELADAMNENIDEVPAARAVPAASRAQYLRSAAPTLPTLGLDMPYYSFGKALPRVSKE